MIKMIAEKETLATETTKNEKLTLPTGPKNNQTNDES
jgi:hypothetical protein